MPVTSTRRISTSSTTGLPPFSGSTLSTSSYRRSTALSPSRFLSTSTSGTNSSSSGLGVGYYRSLSSSTASSNYLSNRNSVAGYPSNESSYVSSRYSNKSTTSGDSGLGSSERARGTGLGSSSRASFARSVALSGADLYAKYSPSNYVPNSTDLSRSRSLTDANRDRLRATNSSYTSGVGSSNTLHPSSHVKSSDTGPSSSSLSSSAYGKKLNSNTIKSPSSTSSSLNRRSQVYYSSSQDEAEGEEGDENNNNGSRSGRSSVRRKGAPPKVALGGAGSALDTVDGDIKVTATSSKAESHNNNPNSAVACGLARKEVEQEEDTNNYSAPQQSRALLLSLSFDAAADNNNPLINRIPSANQSHAKQRQENSGSNKKIININKNNNNNVTRISINHNTTTGSSGTSIILNNNINSQCSSANRAIVHIFKANEQQQQVEDLRNNNNNNNDNISYKSINHRVWTEKSKITCSGGSDHQLNGDTRRQRGANGTRAIETEGSATEAAKSNPNGTMLLRQSNGTSAERSSYGNVNGGGKFRRDSEIFLRDECDLVRNELMQKKIAEHNPVEEHLNGTTNGSAVNGVSRKTSSTSSSLVTKNGGRENNAVVLSNGNHNNGVKTIKVTVRTRPENINNNLNSCNNNYNSKTAGQNLKERMENGFRTELEERRSMILQNGGGGVGHRNGGAPRGRSSPMEIDPSDEPMNGFGRDKSKPAKKSSSHSSSSSSSSASSLMDSGRSNFEDIKFIDSDDNNEASGGGGGAAAVGAAMNGASSRMSKLNKSLASTLETLKASTPIVGSGRQYNVTTMNGHHTLPYHHSNSLGSASGRLAGGDYSKKYSTLSCLPSKSSITAAAIRNGLSNGGGSLFGERKTYSNDAIIMGLVPKEHENEGAGDDEEVKEHELMIKETEMDAMVTSSEPPNDKISGKSWEVNGTNGSGVRTSSLRNALPPVSPVRTWERDRPRYRELLDAEPSTTSSLSSSGSKYDAYDKGSSDTVEGLCGLRNIGNTCFMNSVIQCLSHTNDLTKFLRGQRDPKSTTKDQRIFAEYVKLIKDMWSPSTRTVTPMELKSAVSSKHRMYSGCGQQDAQEFLRFFLEALHGACNEGTKQEGLTLDDNLSDGKRADLMWDWYSKVESSVIKDLFVGQLRSTLRCTVCGNASVTFDPFWDLSVPLPPSSSRCKLENCLELFIREEVLDGDEMPTCSKCKTRRKSTKSFTIQRFPKYLVIHLKRFSETRWSKLTNVVEFPMGDRELNLAPYASNNTAGSPHYSLYGISNHMGSTAGGHYVALCKHPQTRKWHEFNDNHVSDSSESSLISSSAYLLFYERA